LPALRLPPSPLTPSSSSMPISLTPCSPKSTYGMASCWGSGNNYLQEMGLLGLSATSFSGRRPR
jgi:hypothetical protein